MKVAELMTLLQVFAAALKPIAKDILDACPSYEVVYGVFQVEQYTTVSEPGAEEEVTTVQLQEIGIGKPPEARRLIELVLFERDCGEIRISPSSWEDLLYFIGTVYNNHYGYETEAPVFLNEFYPHTE